MVEINHNPNLEDDVSFTQFERLKEVERYVREGKSYIETAQRLGMKEDTIRRYMTEIKNVYKDHNEERPKILLFDTETQTMQVRVWGLYLQKIEIHKVIKDWHLISWAAKWLFEPNVMSDVQTPWEARKRDDKRICKSLWKLFDEADIVIAHNAKRFDVRKCNARWIANKMLPPSPVRILDTLTEAQKIAGFSSHKLDYLAQRYCNDGKTPTDFGLWVGCEHGEQESLDKMVHYNRHDVELLEDVYMLIRPYIKGHPNLGLYDNTDVPLCPTCGGERITDIKKDYYTNVSRFSMFRCKCGAYGRRRKNKLTGTDKMKDMTVSVAR